MIASKDIGLVLRILGQNPTEDQIVEMVMKVSLIVGEIIPHITISSTFPSKNIKFAGQL